MFNDTYRCSTSRSTSTSLSSYSKALTTSNKPDYTPRVLKTTADPTSTSDHVPVISVNSRTPGALSNTSSRRNYSTLAAPIIRDGGRLSSTPEESSVSSVGLSPRGGSGDRLSSEDTFAKRSKENSG